MTREIKFRAWSVLEEKMWTDVLCEMAENDYYNELLSILDIAYYMKTGNQKQFKFMEYTGLKDKNGIEIYEGDIISCFKGRLSVAIFKECSFGIETSGRFTPFFELGGYCEVVGNIYENPKLIND